MPFDAEVSQESRVKLYLQETRDYLQKHGWCQKVMQDPQGRVCIMGALHAVMVGCSDEDGQAVVEALGFGCPRYKNYSLAPYWNDAPGRTFEEVLARIDEAIARS